MKTSIEIVKKYQAWRTHKCDSDSPEGCGAEACLMPDFIARELTDAIDDVIDLAEQWVHYNGIKQEN